VGFGDEPRKSFEEQRFAPREVELKDPERRGVMDHSRPISW
jgi:hypothetical protein